MNYYLYKFFIKIALKYKKIIVLITYNFYLNDIVLFKIIIYLTLQNKNIIKCN